MARQRPNAQSAMSPVRVFRDSCVYVVLNEDMVVCV